MNKDHYIRVGIAAFARGGYIDQAGDRPKSGWQLKAFDEGWHFAMQNAADEKALPKTKLVKAWGSSKRERDAAKRLNATMRECNRAMRNSRLDNETAMLGKARGHYRHAVPVSPNITRR